VSVLEQEPGQASDAFYWAARLDPLNGEALYGRAIASVMRSRPLYRQYMTGGRRTMQSKELRRSIPCSSALTPSTRCSTGGSTAGW
jgi:hypothetical protein